MLRKRNRSVQKDQHMADSHFQSDILGQKHKPNSFFSIPGVFVGFNPSGSSDSDAIRSPTSPLDFRVLSNLGNPFRSPRVPNDVQQRSWGCNKVGLSIIDSLDDNRVGKALQSSDSKTILFGSQMRIRTPNPKTHMNSFEITNSLPTNYAVFPTAQMKSSHSQKGNSDVLFEIGEAPPVEADSFGNIRSCSLDSGRSLLLHNGSADRSPILSSGALSVKTNASGMNSNNKSTKGSTNIDKNLDTILTPNPFSTGSVHGLFGSLSSNEIELSEDYTRVTSHGPNPKTTHIFGDCILECHTKEPSKNEESDMGVPAVVKRLVVSTSFPPNDFLSFCFYCKKKLDGKDIYMYRGEKAFCSLSCRAEEILIEEETEKTSKRSVETSPEKGSCEEPSDAMFVAL